MAPNPLNVIVGTAQVWTAPWGLTTPGTAEPMPSDPTTRTDTVTVTSGSSTISDTSIVSGDKGAEVAGTGIPAGSYVGTVTAGTSFVLVDSAGTPVNATSAGTSVTITGGVAYGQSWGGNWTAVGATEQGVTVSLAPKVNQIYIEEQPNPVASPIDTMDVSIGFTLEEDLLGNLMLAVGVGSVATQAATSSVIGKQTLTLGTVLNPYSVGFESINTFGNGMFRRGYIPKVVSGQAKIDTTYRRAKAARMYAVTLTAICSINDIVFVDQTANPT